MLPSKPIFDPTFLNLDYIFYKVYEFFQSVLAFFGVTNFFGNLYLGLRIFFIVAAILFLFIILYSKKRTHDIHHEMKHNLKGVVAKNPDSSVRNNEKWQAILEHIHSVNPSDWRLAIIEADTILDEMVLSMGYPGDNLGERMKKIERSDFANLDNAWEAHKVRNRIAHEGSDFTLTHDDAKKVIGMYEKVFREFKYV